jgi:diphthamide synthase (EF-2-diphthine--ammonia ligase)
VSRPRALLSWSSGKDSAWALHVLRAAGEVDVVGLVSTVSVAHDRVAMHAVRRTLLEAQARAVGLPLRIVGLPSPCSNAEYEAAIGAVLAEARDEGIDAMAFGDLFLADIRRYREQQLADTGIRPLFPLWNQPTRALADAMLAAGVCAHVTCVDPSQVPAALAGRTWDAAFLPTCRPARIRAARTASSTPSCRRGRCSRPRSPCAPARSSSATASCSRTCCRPDYAAPTGSSRQRT